MVFNASKYEFILKAVDQTKGAFKSLDASLRKSQAQTEKFKKEFAGINKAAKGAIIPLTAVAASMGAVGVKAIQMAADFEETENRFRATFGNNADIVNEYVEEVSRSLGRARGETKDALSSFQGFAVGLGFGEETATKFSTKLHQLSLDFASFNNLSDGEAQQRFISALSGSGEVLDRFGINIKQAALDQELLKMGVEGGTLAATEQEKAMARLGIIMESMGRQGAVGDAVKTSDSFVNVMKRLKGQLNDLAVSIGQTLIPVVQPLIKFVADLATKINNLDDRWKKIIGVVIAATAGLAALGVVLAGLVLVFPAIVAGITAVGTALMFLVGNPVGIVITAIGALAIAWTTNVGNIQQRTAQFGAVLMIVFQNVVKAVGDAKDFMMGKLNDIVNGFKIMGAAIEYSWSIMIENMKGFFATFVGGFLEDKINEAIELINILPGVEIKNLEMSKKATENIEAKKADIVAKYEKQKADILQKHSIFNESLESDKLAREQKFNAQRQDMFAAILEIEKDIKKTRESTPESPAVDTSGLDLSASLGANGADFFNQLDFSGGAGAAGAAVSKATSKVAEKLQTLTESYRDTIDKGREEMNKLIVEHTKTTEKIKSKISELETALKDLESTYKDTMSGLDQSLGNAVVDQEEKIKSLKASIKDAKDEIRDLQKDQSQASSGDSRNDIGERIADAKEALKVKEDALKKEQEALEQFQQNSIDLDDEIAEARRRNALTEFERFVEDNEAKRAAETESFELKKSQIRAELEEQQIALEQEDAIFKEKYELYKQALDTHELMVAGIVSGNNTMKNNTQATVDQMKAKLAELERVLDRIRAITAPKEGPDRRTDNDVFNISGADAPFGETNDAFTPRRAFGGFVQAGKEYLVGERGAETFVPSTSGVVVPNGQNQGGGGAPKIEINITGNNIDSDDRVDQLAETVMARLKNVADLQRFGIIA